MRPDVSFLDSVHVSILRCVQGFRWLETVGNFAVQDLFNAVLEDV